MTHDDDDRQDLVLMPPARPVAVPTHAAHAIAEPVAAPVAPTACPNLSKALGEARDRCRMALKDKRNEFHKYDYASADGIIQTARDAMHGTGLALIPQAQELTLLAAGNVVMHALNRTLLLSHSSGEFVPLSIRGWPVVPERGRPLDKAFAVALTTSLSYLLRDLLQMPRGDEADMNARNDLPQEAARPAKPAAEPVVSPVVKHARAIEEAETMDALRTVFKAAMADRKLTDDERHDLAALKDERKQVMENAKPLFAGQQQAGADQLAAMKG
jgi:hypothetical protein